MSRLIASGVRAVRRLVVAVVGSTVILVGIALIVLPGPAFVVLPIGLGILALEFAWARSLFRRAQNLYLRQISTPTPADENADAEGTSKREANRQPNLTRQDRNPE